MRKASIVLAIAGMWLVACGASLEGTWENTTGPAAGTWTITFESNGYTMVTKSYSIDTSTGTRTDLGTTNRSGTYALSG
jgi:hypothetical protein